MEEVGDQVLHCLISHFCGSASKFVCKSGVRMRNSYTELLDTCVKYVAGYMCKICCW